MNRVDFAIVLHFHQPVGNFTEVFERAYQRCYRPFLEYLKYYPRMKMTLHISGSLIDYFKNTHPEFLKLIKGLVSEKRIDVMGGPYYEPILPAIPKTDIAGQLNLMSKAIKDEFGVRPEGAWIPERVWNQDIVRDLYKCGVRYLLLDDAHFMKSGFKKEETYRYFTTGSKSQRIAVFPSDKKLRYAIPFKYPRETIDYLKRISRKKASPLFIYADDVEKFGEWPGTYNWVYKSGWLKNFFDALDKNSGWINLVTPADYMKSKRPASNVRIPEASYDEMMKWSKGSWFNFLKRYPESKHMYRKMLYVSDKVKRLKKTGGNKSDTYWAKIELYRGECNCGYWHGVFGGLYMYHLRSAIYNHLIAAENIADRMIYKGAKFTQIKRYDFDSDGKDDFILENETLSLYIDPAGGGTLRELDYRPICANLVNTLSRKKEEYHKEVAKLEPSLKEKLVYDRYPRSCLRDHFVAKGLKRGSFIESSFKDYGRFADSKYSAQEKPCGMILKRRSSISGVKVDLTKEVIIKGKNIEVNYTIKKDKKRKLNLLFGTEFNLTMPFLNSYRYRYFSKKDMLDTLNTTGVIDRVTDFGIRDSRKELDIKLEFSKKAEKIWYFPVETVSKAQTTYRLNYQCTCVFPMWKPDFGNDGCWNLKITWCIGQA